MVFASKHVYVCIHGIDTVRQEIKGYGNSGCRGDGRKEEQEEEEVEEEGGWGRECSMNEWLVLYVG